MPLITPGTPVAERLIFNSGLLDLGTNELVDVENITVEITFAEKELRRLNSIKMASHKRATFKCGLRARVKAMSKEVFTKIMGTIATDGSGSLISVTDGQYTATLNPVLTVYVDDNVAKPIQFQFSDAFITTSPVTAALEEYGVIDIDLVARDVSVFYYE